MSFKRRPLWWILGGALALIGVAIARILGPQVLPVYQPSVFAAGATIAVLGVFVAALGSWRGGSPDPHE
jgi:hypothetical protein